MEKIFGKNKEFKLINSFSEKKTTYTRYYYNCECINCGFKRLLSQSDANDGICLECKKKKTIDNVIGKRINIYKVLNFSHNKFNSNFYNCECLKCGEESVVNINSIKINKNCQNCRKHGSEATEVAQLNYKIDQYKRGVNQRKIEYKLNLEEFKRLIFSKCYYCNDEPEEKTYKNSKNKIKRNKFNGIDRIDSSKGYVIENCIPCCEMCNRMKMAHKQEKFLDQIKKIYNNILKK